MTLDKITTAKQKPNQIQTNAGQFSRWNNKTNQKQENILLVDYKIICFWLTYLDLDWRHSHFCLVQLQWNKRQRPLTPHSSPWLRVREGTCFHFCFSTCLYFRWWRERRLSCCGALVKKTNKRKWHAGRMSTLTIVGQGNTAPAHWAPGFWLAGCRRQDWSELAGTPKSTGSRRWKSLHQHAQSPQWTGEARHSPDTRLPPPRTNVAITSRVTAG